MSSALQIPLLWFQIPLLTSEERFSYSSLAVPSEFFPYRNRVSNGLMSNFHEMFGPSRLSSTNPSNRRTAFGKRGCAVFAWPSAGGVLIKEPANAVDLDYLGLNRFQSSFKSTDPIEEDLFCEKLQRLGAKWWRSEDDYVEVLLGLRERNPAELAEVTFGWPSTGGMWFLRFEHEQQLPHDFGKINMAMNMDERCRVIEAYGGTFYPNSTAVDDQVSWPYTSHSASRSS